MVSWSAQAAITKYHRLGGLNDRHLFLTVLEAGKSKIKVPADSVPGRSLFLACRQMAAFSLCPHLAKKRRALISLSLLIRTLILSQGPYSHELI